MNKCPYTLFRAITQKLRWVSPEISKDDPKFQTYKMIGDYLQEIFPQSFFDEILLEVEHIDESGRIVWIDLDEEMRWLWDDMAQLVECGSLQSSLAKKVYYLNERCKQAVIDFFMMRDSENPNAYTLIWISWDSDFSAAVRWGIGTFFHEFLFCISGFTDVWAKNGPIIVSNITAIHGEKASIEKTLRMSGFLSRSNIQFSPSNYTFDVSTWLLTRVNGMREPEKNNAVGCPAIRKFSWWDEPVFHRLFETLWKVVTSELPVISHTHIIEATSGQVCRWIE